MPEIPLLGQGKKEEKKAPEIIEAKTAYLVYLPKDGPAVMTYDINTPLTIERQAQPPDVIGSMAEVTAFVQAQLTATMVMANLNQLGQQAQAMQQMKNTVDPETLRKMGMR